MLTQHQHRDVLLAQALHKIKAKHEDANFTLTLPEYEEILDALVGSHFQNVPSHLSHSSHDELGQLLIGVNYSALQIFSVAAICTSALIHNPLQYLQMVPRQN